MPKGSGKSGGKPSATQGVSRKALVKPWGQIGPLTPGQKAAIAAREKASAREDKIVQQQGVIARDLKVNVLAAKKDWDALDAKSTRASNDYLKTTANLMGEHAIALRDDALKILEKAKSGKVLSPKEAEQFKVLRERAFALSDDAKELGEMAVKSEHKPEVLELSTITIEPGATKDPRDVDIQSRERESEFDLPKSKITLRGPPAKLIEGIPKAPGKAKSSGSQSVKFE